ncbi:MAG: glycosyl hydrolase family 65 protein, partial [Solirubrobacteraceae bacterium]
PRLAGALTRLRFRLMFQGSSLLVDVNHQHATYSLLRGEPLALSHHGEALTVSANSPVTLAIPAVKARAEPPQPRGREPLRRRPPR